VGFKLNPDRDKDIIYSPKREKGSMGRRKKKKHQNKEGSWRMSPRENRNTEA